MDHRGGFESDKACYWVMAGVVAFALSIRLAGLSKGVATNGRSGAEYRTELMASLESEFGHPGSVQEREMFTMLEYGPCGNE